MRGYIKSLQTDRGFGFIRADNGYEYFFHMSGISEEFGTLKVGMKVEFEGVETAKGKRAEAVVLTAETK